MEVPSNEKTLRRIFWFALAGASLAVASLYVGEPYFAPYFVPFCGTFGGILGGLTGLAFPVSKKGAVVGAWIGGLLGVAILLDGIFAPIIAFGLPFHWYQLLILPFGAAFGSAIGSVIGAIIGWTINTLRRISHDR